jgi:hypothetical protein
MVNGKPAFLRTVKAPRIAVSPSGYDDMGAVLSGMNLVFEPVDWKQVAALGAGAKFNVLFLNCAGGIPALPRLRAFVEDGGHVFCSDYASECVAGLGLSGVAFQRDGDAGVLTADVVDPDFQSVLQCATVPIEFDMGSWDRSVTVPKWAHVLLAAPDPLAWSCRWGRGSVTFTSFHHHAQPTELEGLLLSLLALMPVSMHAGVSVADLAQETIRRG